MPRLLPRNSQILLQWSSHGWKNRLSSFVWIHRNSWTWNNIPKNANIIRVIETSYWIQTQSSSKYWCEVDKIRETHCLLLSRFALGIFTWFSLESSDVSKGLFGRGDQSGPPLLEATLVFMLLIEPLVVMTAWIVTSRQDGGCDGWKNSSSSLLMTIKNIFFHIVI